jgi:hypothetical protein
MKQVEPGRDERELTPVDSVSDLFNVPPDAVQASSV